MAGRCGRKPVRRSARRQPRADGRCPSALAGRMAARRRAGREATDRPVISSPAPNARSPRPEGQDGLTSVIIVAADSGAGPAECVGRVLDGTAKVEVIVVDNASSDGCVDAIASRWPDDARVRIVRNATNLGFGTGCNRGAAIATGDVLLFLNPDCAVAPDTLARLRAASNPAIGLLGVDIVDAAGTPEPASRRRDPLLRRALMTVTGLARFE